MSINSPKNIILAPIITEKSIAAQSNGLYYFWVSNKATKKQIALTFKEVFSIPVIGVRTIRTHGKNKTDWKKRHSFHTSIRKKALVKIAKDQKIELLKLNTKQ